MLTCSDLVVKFSHMLWNPTAQYYLYKRPAPVFTLGHTKLVQASTFHFLTTYLWTYAYFVSFDVANVDGM